MRCADENNLSHHFLEDALVQQEPAEKSEGTGEGVFRLATILQVTRRRSFKCWVIPPLGQELSRALPGISSFKTQKSL